MGIAVCEDAEMGVGGAYFTVTISAMPLPSIANAGISNQNHQTWPAGAKKNAAQATSINPIPIKAFVMPLARVAGPSSSRWR